MSRGEPERLGFVPLIALVEKAARALRADMLRAAHENGFTELQPAHNAVFATLPRGGARAADMAARSGITRQSMGEVIRDMVKQGLLEMVPDPEDGRAKIVRFTDHGLEVAASGHEHIRAIDRLFRDRYGDEDFEIACRVLAGIQEVLGSAVSAEPAPAGVNPLTSS